MSPLGPACAAGCLWPGLWAVDSDSGGHAGRHTADMFPLRPGSWPQTSSYWPAAPAPKHLPRLPCPLGPACDKGPPQPVWACLPSGRATQGLGQVTGSQRDLQERRQLCRPGRVGEGRCPAAAQQRLSSGEHSRPLYRPISQPPLVTRQRAPRAAKAQEPRTGLLCVPSCPHPCGTNFESLHSSRHACVPSGGPGLN